MPVPISTNATFSTVSSVLQYFPYTVTWKAFPRSFSPNWEWSGITTFYTGTPFSVLNGIFADNAGVANGVGTNGSSPDVVGNPQVHTARRTLWPHWVRARVLCCLTLPRTPRRKASR